MTAVSISLLRLGPRTLTAFTVAAWLTLSLGLGILGTRAPITAVIVAVAAAAISPLRRHWAALPVVAATLMVFVLYTRVSDVGIEFHNFPSIAQPLVVALALVTFIRRSGAKKQSDLDLHRGVWAAIGLYLALLYVSIIWAIDGDVALYTANELLKNLLIIYIMVATFNTLPWLRIAVWMFIASGTLLAGLTVFQAATHTFGNSYGGLAQAPIRQITAGLNSADSYRSSGPVGDPNFYGLILAVLVPLALVRIRDERDGRLRLAAVGSTILLLAGVALTYSRGDVIALVVMALLYVLLLRVRLIHVFVALIVLAPVAAVAPASFWQRIASIGSLASASNGQSDPSFTDRAGGAAVALAVFNDHPLFGVGAANYINVYLPYSRQLHLPNASPRPHDLYLQVGAETGLLGLATFGAALLLTVGAVWRARVSMLRRGNREAVGLVTSCLLAFVTFLVGNALLPSAYPRYLWMFMGLALASSIAMRQGVVGVRPGLPTTVQGGAA